MSIKRLALALQGGGSHGAYTWGVLDRLLEEETIWIEALSGASAGAVNAVVLAHGLAEGGREGAKRALETFWHALGRTPYSSIGAVSPSQRADPASRSFLFLARFFSPYQLNPLNINPLRDILSSQIDFERLRTQRAMKLFISATRVSNGALRIFAREEITLDALLASACIPSMHHTVAVDGIPYWDGGLAANPPLSVLVYKCDARDVLVVVLNPCSGDDIPSTAEAIGDRLTQISFSSTLSTELHAIALAQEEAKQSRFAFGRLDRKLKRLNLHMIDSGAYIAKLDPKTRLNTDASFIASLREEGRRSAEAWLERNARSIGTRSTVSFDAPLLQA
jgi:NTE family protein